MAAYDTSCYGFPVWTTPVPGYGMRLEPSSQRMGPLGSLQPLPAGAYQGAVGGFAGLRGLHAIVPVRPPGDLRGVGMGALQGQAWDRFKAWMGPIMEVGGAVTGVGCESIEDPDTRQACINYSGAAGAFGRGETEQAVVESCIATCFARELSGAEFTRCMERCPRVGAAAGVADRAAREAIARGDQPAPDLCDDPETPAFVRAIACSEARVPYGGAAPASTTLERKRLGRNIGAAVGGAAVAALLVKLLLF